MALSRGRTTNSAVVALDDRLMDLGGTVVNADGTPRTGVRGGANLSIVTATGNTGPMTVNVAAAAFVTSKGVADGVALPTNDGTVSVPLGAAPGSNSLIRVIWVKQQDNTTGDAASTPIFGYTDGAAAASPTKPAIPTGALELATLRVYAGTTASNGGSNVLTNTYQMTAARGGIVPVRTIAERDAWVGPAPVDGQLAWVAADDALYQYVDSGVGWVHHGGKPLFSAVSYTGIYSAGVPAARVVEQGGRVSLEGFSASSAANFVAGTLYTLGSIPTAKAPVATRVFACVANTTALAEITVDTAGVISFVVNISFGPAPLDLSLAGCSWPDKRLG